MSTLKKFFPYSFGTKDNTTAFITRIIVYVCLPALLGAAIWLVTTIIGFVPFVGGVIAAILGWILGIISSVFGTYCLAGIVFLILDFCKVFKE